MRISLKAFGSPRSRREVVVEDSTTVSGPSAVVVVAAVPLACAPASRAGSATSPTCRWPDSTSRTPCRAKAASARAAPPTARASGSARGGRKGWWATTMRVRPGGSAASRASQRASRSLLTRPRDQSAYQPPRRAVFSPTTPTRASWKTGSVSAATCRRQRA